MDITVFDLKKIYNPNIIDIRPTLNYNNGHIINSKNIPYNDLLVNHSKYLNKNDKYYIYCKRGQTSKGLCQILNNMGYHTYSIIGGYEAYILNN